MNKYLRVVIQLIIWLLFWIPLWNSIWQSNGFLIDNLMVFVFQVLIICSITFYIAPFILFKKKHLPFFLISIIMVAGMAFIIFEIATSEAAMQGLPSVSKSKAILGRPNPNQFIRSFLLLGFTYTITVFWESLTFARKKEKETIENKADQLQMELKLLKSQINPHFLFNTLNNIYALSVLDSNKTQQSILHLSDMLRYVLYDCEEPWVSISQEVKYIENYVKLFTVKEENELPITLKFETTDPSVKIAPMLFIPFIENAFKHSAIDTQGKDSFIHVHIQQMDQKVTLIVTNSVPLTPIKKDESGGIGIENVKKRLSILYPKSHELDIMETGNEFKVQLTINSNHHV